MRLYAILFFMLCAAAPSMANPAPPWQPVTDVQAMTDLLTENTLVYDTGAVQRFYPSGRTLYELGEPSWGTWRVDNGQYCSTWPPSADWACYDVAYDGQTAVQFTDDRGHAVVGIFAE